MSMVFMVIHGFGWLSLYIRKMSKYTSKDKKSTHHGTDEENKVGLMHCHACSSLVYWDPQ